MVQGLESQLKQLVLNTGPFGPQEIHAHRTGHRRRFCRIPRAARRGGRAGNRRRQKPRRRRPAGRLLLPAGPLQPGPGNAEDRRWRSAGPVLPGQGRRGPQAIRRGRQLLHRRPQGRLQRRRLRPGPGRGRPPGRRLPRLAGRFSTTCREPSSKRPNISTSAVPASRPSAAIRPKSWPCSSGPSRPIATMPAPCSAWPWKTIAAATTKWPSTFTSARPTSFPPTSARC